MRASVLFLAFAALVAAQDFSIETTTTDAAVDTTETSTFVLDPSETTTGIDTASETPSETPSETSTDSSDNTTTSEPVIPTGLIPSDSPIGSSSGFTSSPSPTTRSTTSTRTSTSTRDSTETDTQTVTNTPSATNSNSNDAEETDSDNAAFALPTAGPLLGAGLAGAALAAFL